jgi:hypothetical protein
MVHLRIHMRRFANHESRVREVVILRLQCRSRSRMNQYEPLAAMGGEAAGQTDERA